jgi:hypothetical protein
VVATRYEILFGDGGRSEFNSRHERRFEVGDFVNLPRPAEPGRERVYRVAAVQPSGDPAFDGRIVLEQSPLPPGVFRRAWTE